MKKVIAILLAGLCAVSVLGCADGACPRTAEETAGYDADAGLTLSAMAAANDTPYQGANVFGVTNSKSQEIWAWAEQCYQEWYPRYLEMLEAKKSDTAVAYIKEDSSEWSKGVYSDPNWTYETYQESGTYRYRATRTLSTLKGWTTCTQKSTEYLTDTYGGLVDASMKQEAKGVYYTAKIGGRWWLIDPLGYPMYLKGLMGVVDNYYNNDRQRTASMNRFGSEEKWSIAAKFEMQNTLGFNTVTGWDTQNGVVEVPEAMPYNVTVHVVVYYGVELGIAKKSGSSVFTEADNVAQNTMPVFDPDFIPYAENAVKKDMEKVNGNSQVMYYQTDNEIPLDEDMLMNYLTLDPSAEVNGNKVNMYSYAAAWTWLYHMTGKQDCEEKDVTDTLKEIFRGFVYDRYYSVVIPFCKKYDDGTHLCAGVRFLSGSAGAHHSVVDAEWVVRTAAYWTDIISINWYGQWTPSTDSLRNLTIWSGDKPFLVSEFNARADEPLDGTVYHQVSTGGGWYVKDYADQAAFYENFILRILEWKSNIGYCWYRYSNYWVGSTFKSGSGIIDDDNNYKDVAYSMMNVNKNIYGLIAFLDERQK